MTLAAEVATLKAEVARLEAEVTRLSGVPHAGALNTAEWPEGIPEADGWFWIAYPVEKEKGVKTVVLPCLVTHLDIGTHVTTARNDSFGDKTRKFFGFAAARFGPPIPYRQS